MLQQPYVPFASDEERSEYMGKLDAQEKWIKETPRDGGSVRAGDAQYFDKLIHDTHKKAADSNQRPAKMGEAAFDAELHSLVCRIGTAWIAVCKRQVVDGEHGRRWIIEVWIYVPHGNRNRGGGVDYNGPRSRL